MRQDSEFFEACARHSNRQTARTLQTIYLCDPCTRRLVREAFNERPPIYHGETINGYCGLCNERRQVTLRCWFACNICWNVILAYQKAFVASQAIHDYWERTISTTLPSFTLEETEPVLLAPYTPGGKTKRQTAVTLEHLDFLVREDHGTGDPEAQFHIELKSGPAALDRMREFQLDVNDFNDIAGAVNHSGLPAYIFHVQLEQEYTVPTRRTVAAGTWWTDVFALHEHPTRVKSRRGEDKRAGYYDTSAFAPIESFPSQIEQRRFEVLRDRVADGISMIE